MIAETSEEKDCQSLRSHTKAQEVLSIVNLINVILIDPKGNEVTREISGETYENTDVVMATNQLYSLTSQRCRGYCFNVPHTC